MRTPDGDVDEQEEGDDRQEDDERAHRRVLLRGGDDHAGALDLGDPHAVPAGTAPVGGLGPPLLPVDAHHAGLWWPGSIGSRTTAAAPDEAPGADAVGAGRRGRGGGPAAAGRRRRRRETPTKAAHSPATATSAKARTAATAPRRCANGARKKAPGVAISPMPKTTAAPSQIHRQLSGSSMAAEATGAAVTEAPQRSEVEGPVRDLGAVGVGDHALAARVDEQLGAVVGARRSCPTPAPVPSAGPACGDGHQAGGLGAGDRSASRRSGRGRRALAARSLGERVSAVVGEGPGAGTAPAVRWQRRSSPARPSVGQACSGSRPRHRAPGSPR